MSKKDAIPLLTEPVLLSMEKAVKSGVPVVAAGGMLGFTPKTVQAWMALGMQYTEKDPKKYGSNVTCGFAGQDLDAKTWHKLAKCCSALARTVLRVEGTLIGNLVRRLWLDSKINPDTMKFLFKQYTHAHGIREREEQKIVVQGPDDADGNPTTPGIVLYLPHNGREAPVVPLSGKK